MATIGVGRTIGNNDLEQRGLSNPFAGAPMGAKALALGSLATVATAFVGEKVGVPRAVVWGSRAVVAGAAAAAGFAAGVVAVYRDEHGVDQEDIQ